MTTYSVVTTFHNEGYQTYGKRMIQTFLKNWPSEVTLYVYAENVNVEERASNLVVLDESADLKRFVDTWKHVPHANGDVSGIPRLAARKDSHKPFKWQAVRFAHKVYAIFDCAEKCDTDFLLWMDADTVCHSPITMETVSKLVPDNIDLAYLGRERKFSECGLYAMNLKSPSTQQFLFAFKTMYEDANNGIFTLDEWHDSFVFDAVRVKQNLRELNWSKGLIQGEGHPLINSAWGAYLDHLKGARKKTGKSLKQDLLVKRTESYWT